MSRTLVDIRKENPYPKDIFIERTPEDWNQVHKLLKDNGLCLDGFNGSLSRMVWNNCCDKLEELIDERITIFVDQNKRFENLLSHCENNIIEKLTRRDIKGNEMRIDELNRFKGR